MSNSHEFYKRCTVRRLLHVHGIANTLSSLLQQQSTLKPDWGLLSDYDRLREDVVHLIATYRMLYSLTC
jgi:hypothetical protein